MSNIAAYVAGNVVNKTGKLFAALTSPKWLKNGLVTTLTITIISQLFIFYVIIAARVNPSDSWKEAFTALKCADCSIILLWEMLITALGLFMLQFKAVIFVLSVFILCTGILLIRIIPDEWYEVGDILVILLLLAAPVGIVGLAVLELLPFVINNYF